MLTDVGRSNVFTMNATATIDRRQQLPSDYEIPPADVRLLRAKLLLEECLETVAALGFTLAGYEEGKVEESELNTGEEGPDLWGILDGCCDTVYVAIGTMLACGAPDQPHLEAVCFANDAKFPGGVATMHPTIPGKFGKPPGWTPPNHEEVSNWVRQRRKAEPFPLPPVDPLDELDEGN